MRRAILLGLLLTFLCCLPAQAALRALLVGVNEYVTASRLYGAVNDVRDLERTLRNAGVEDVTTLVNEAADFTSFDAAWNAMIARSAPGDVIFFSFSGHGIRVKQTGPVTTFDGYDKGFLLHPFHKDDAPDEILRDEHLYDRFALATAKGLKVLFVADACHAGFGVRSSDPRANTGVRFHRYDTGTPQLVVAPSAEPAIAERPRNPGVTVFSANRPEVTIQEVVIDNESRGVLSYAVARGIETVGRESGRVALGALRQAVSPMIREFSSNRQSPIFVIPDDDLAILDTPSEGPTPTDSLDAVTLAVTGAATVDGLDGARLVSSGADLIWDSSREQLVAGDGDVLASGIDAEALQDAVDARRVLNALRRRLASQIADAGTSIGNAGNPDGSRYFLSGESVQITMAPGDYGYATLLDLTANGTVQLVWPIESLGDPVGGALTQANTFTAPVTGPFGADFIVTILSREPLTALHESLMRLHNSVAPLAFFRAFQQAAANADLRIGINSIFSCETLRSNGQCESMLAP